MARILSAGSRRVLTSTSPALEVCSTAALLGYAIGGLHRNERLGPLLMRS
jgi:hypothetical protein